MPRRPADRLPSYRLHKASGQAVVTLSGRDHYLGTYETAASRAEYDRVVGLWQINGRRQLVSAPETITVNELILAYWKHAEGYYRKRGEPTSQLNTVKRVLKIVRELFGARPVTEFGPLALKSVRQSMIDAGLSRGVINGRVSNIRLMFRWGVEQELIPETIYSALMAVRSLAKGRTAAKDHPPIAPAPDAYVQAILPLVRPAIRAMIELQLLSGMRPGEVIAMRSEDIDRSADVWAYRVVHDVNKTHHHDKARTVYFGPRAQAVLRPWIEQFPTGYLFRPRGWDSKPTKKRKTDRKVGPHYDITSYHFAIQFACDKAFPHPTLSKVEESDLSPAQLEELKAWRKAHRWSPNRLRHNAATMVRKAAGVEVARTVLGHSNLKTSEIYAEQDVEKARAIVREIG